MNHLYFNSRNGRKLTTKGRVYKRKVKGKVADVMLVKGVGADELTLLALGPLVVVYQLWFTSTVSKGYLKGKAKNLHRKIDTSNRLKVLEDSLFEGLGVDDSLTYIPIPVKLMGEEEKAAITVYYADPISFGIPGEYYGD